MNEELNQAKLRSLVRELNLNREREKKQIAKSLHDNLGQSLAYIRMKLMSLRGDAVFSGFDKNVDEILRMLDTTIRRTRTLCFEISPPVLHELGLTAALEWLAEYTENKHGLHVDIDGDKEIETEDRILDTQLFSATRELINNVVKHANAERASIWYDQRDHTAMIEVSDNGNGFDAASLHDIPSGGEGFGLFSIREQLDYYGGRLHLESTPGKGSKATLTVPLTRD